MWNCIVDRNKQKKFLKTDIIRTDFNLTAASERAATAAAAAMAGGLAGCGLLPVSQSRGFEPLNDRLHWQTIFVWLRNDQIIFLGSEFDVIFGQCDHIERFITIWATF